MSPASIAPAEPRKASREVELSLVVTDRDPEGFRRRLARLRQLERYELRARGSESIVDRYFDTPDARLRHQGLALRLRTTGGETTIGVKGRRKQSSTRTEDRFERERPFSAEGVAEVGRQLGLRRGGLDALADGSDPATVLEAALGVRLLQRRETTRLVRDVVDAREPAGPVLAELVLDRVQFRFGRRRIRHYEVEVEAKRTGRGTVASREVAAELHARFPDQLAEWPYGKLPTGLAIEALLAKGALERATYNGALRPQAYARIRQYLDRQERAVRPKPA